MNPIKFGTDGWRGIIAEDFTFDNVRLCAQGLADYLIGSGQAGRGLVIGYDTRFASEDFARTAAEVVSANGVKVYLCDKATPTPVVSYGVLAKSAGGAIVITASHNPPLWNGFKVKSADGTSAPTEVIAEIEKNIAAITATGGVKRLPLVDGIKQGLVEYTDLQPVYIKHIKSLVDLDGLREKRFKVVIDSMYGAGAGYFKTLLTGGAMEVIEINSERNPAFPGIKQPEPIAANLAKLSARIRAGEANIGIATDGDADRLGIVDEKGDFLTQLQVYALLALYLLEVRGERGAIVKTITTTGMLDRLGEMFSVPVYETRVGFKHVAQKMLAENALIGGEESGGYGFRRHMPERDAIISGLYFLDLMARTGKTPAQLLGYLFSKVGPHYYDRLDIEFDGEQREEITSRVRDSSPGVLGGVMVARKDTIDGFRFILEDTSWLLIRFSGTEPLLRIYAESDSPGRVAKLLKEGRGIAGV